jgi:hypothetical protein
MGYFRTFSAARPCTRMALMPGDKLEAVENISHQFRQEIVEAFDPFKVGSVVGDSSAAGHPNSTNQ